MYDVRSTMYDSLLHLWRRVRDEVELSSFESLSSLVPALHSKSGARPLHKTFTVFSISIGQPLSGRISVNF
jgi:hypothetical protein